ncbi:relaxase domain-containing protein, partial [Nocardia sp. NPDC052278]|uniref:relaxase domain-containing protein n=1 Tax=unclassified Nocardia TaxID=2637762 RepID=UPI0036936EB2
MTATLHKITAGDGFEYYTRRVAAHDASTRGRAPLSDYYAAHGESPGRWFGTGLHGLTVTH